MSLMQWACIGAALLGVCWWWPGCAMAQGNFEIQVYGSETVAPGQTMFELHTNTAIKGTAQKEAGVFPTQHAWHETIEITHGFTPWFEIGFYIFACRTFDPSDYAQCIAAIFREHRIVGKGHATEEARLASDTRRTVGTGRHPTPIRRQWECHACSPNRSIFLR